ncbi:GTPase ObgE [Candidatus Aerophobetes bacterium]|uniref:GTPase Obg n=1 Tax=Aerophobetes bacterium TaxID=2030807 RepID=A0A2A4WXP5_UNCAE|nr:MAG: GTPase ObgE [Candidatus Aerophobetes bacterium]
MFTDKVKIKFQAGRGGHGIVSWRREKALPKGGPYGGNGGCGGSVTLITDEQLASLEHLRNRRLIGAKNGDAGKTANKTGKTANDIIIRVPVGTIVRDSLTGAILYRLETTGETVCLCKGGRGGLGNSCFKTPTNQAPNKCTPGKPGELADVEIELKIIADIGLVGFPSAGKSTLISQVTKVPFKAAAYHFTTLQPNVAVLEFDDYSRIRIADIPGIIDGAHQNRGLGHAFLKHIERCSTLVYVLDMSMLCKDPLNDFAILKKELQHHNPALLEKHFLVALNKIDCPESQESVDEFFKVHSDLKAKTFSISSSTGEGVGALVDAMRALAQTNGKCFA